MKIPLVQGAYETKSLISSAQKSINLYQEKNPEDAPFPVTHYLTPGLVKLSSGTSLSNSNQVRCTFRTSTGLLYVVIGVTVYYVSPAFVFTSLGTIDAGNNPVSMQDNGLVVLIADNTANLYAIDISSSAPGTFAKVTDPNVLGGTKVDVLDTFFLLNVPNKNQWYISLSEVNFSMLTGVIGSILTGSITSPGASYTNGIYTNVAFTGGTGNGATGNFVVSGNTFTSVIPNIPGKGYVVGDVLSTTLPGDNAIRTGTLTQGGSLYNNGTYTAIPLTGGSGTGATATITVAGNTVTNVVMVSNGSGFTVGNVLSTISIPGPQGILTGTITNGGTGYFPGIYHNVPLTGGAGTGVEVTITVNSGGVINNITIQTEEGVGYLVGDTLGVNPNFDGIGLGSGFLYTVNTVSEGSGFSYTVNTVGGTGFTYTVNTVGGNAFDPLDIATKTTYPDAIQSLIVMHGEIWIVGTLTTEIWYNSGAADFTFQILPGTFIEHGTIAPYSLCKQDLSVYWISQDEQGQAIVIKGTGYQAKRISNFAIENTLSTYKTVSDCIGFTYQQEGHTFVVFSFPSANATWIYDETMGLWHQRCWTDNNGNLNRHRMNVGCNAYNKNIVGDWQNGNLYALDLDTYVDNIDGLGLNPDGSYPISRIRSWPVQIEENNRISYNSFRADMQVGSTLNTQSSNPPAVNLRWSDDRGITYGNYLQQSLGAQGQYLANLQWRRLGQARGRIYELSWSANGNTALNGAWLTATPAGT